MILRWKVAQWFEAWWWRRYLKRKPVEEYLNWKKNYWNEFLAAADIRISSTEKVLDAGCGPAGIFMAFPKNEVTAIDPLLDKYKTQLAHFQQDRFKNVAFIKMPLEQFSSPGSYHSIFCLNVINHVAEMDVCLKNLHIALRTEGKIYLTVDAHNFSFLKRIFRLLPGDILHPHQLDLPEYKKRVEEAGFQIEKTSLLKNELIFDYHLIEAKKA